MRNSFPLFQSHLDLAHHYWSQMLKVGDIAIDATCGHGYDTLKLCQLVLSPHKGKVYAFDVQEIAIHSTRQHIANHLDIKIQQHLTLRQRCHSTFPSEIISASVKLIVYNLGYLPRGNKTLVTQANTTLKSLYQAEKLLQPGGTMSITCYPGHQEGAVEQESILYYASQLSPQQWSCCHHKWLNRYHSPSLLLIQKTNDN